MDDAVDNKEILAQIRDLSHSIKLANEKMDLHIAADESFQKRMEPMVNLFEENNIVKMKLSKDAKTIFFYSTGIASVGAVIYGVIWAIWYFVTHLKI